MSDDDPGEKLDSAMRKVRLAIKDLYPTHENSLSELSALGTALFRHAIGFLANARYMQITQSSPSKEALQSITSKTSKSAFDIIDETIGKARHKHGK